MFQGWHSLLLPRNGVGHRFVKERGAPVGAPLVSLVFVCLAPADHHLDREAPALDHASPRALAEDAADAPGAGAADATHGAACSADLSLPARASVRSPSARGSAPVVAAVAEVAAVVAEVVEVVEAEVVAEAAAEVAEAEVEVVAVAVVAVVVEEEEVVAEVVPSAPASPRLPARSRRRRGRRPRRSCSRRARLR